MHDVDYIAALDLVVLPVAQSFDPDLVILAAGFDAAAGDPLGGFIGRERFVEQLRRPLAHEPPDPAVDPGDHVIQVDGLVARSPEVRDAGGFDRGSAALGVEIPELFCESGAVHHSPSGSLPIAAMRR